MSHLYQVTVKGRNLIELKKAVEDLYNELTNGLLSSIPRASIVKDMEASDETNFETEADEDYTEDLASKHLPQSVPVNATTEEVDSTGSVWNASIHSSSKAKNKDGTWKARRNVNAITTPTVVTPPVQTIVTPPPAQVVEAPPVQVAPPMPTAIMNNGYTQESFVANFPLILSQLITAGKITQQYVEQVKQYFGVIEIWNINDTQKIEMFNNLVQYNVIAKVG